MGRCLRCGAGNEWIEPVERDAKTASLQHRLAVAEKALEEIVDERNEKLLVIYDAERIASRALEEIQDAKG